MKIFKNMRRAKLTLGVVTVAMLASAIAPKAQAYDEDTHFYGTYSLARFAGIRHEVASKLALSAQWMDESYISDPTSMIFLPVTGVKKRRLLHFPSSRVVGQVNAGAQRSILGFDKLTTVQKEVAKKIGTFIGSETDLESLNFFTETQEDHPFASELLMEGIKRGDLMMAGASLHVLEDSFAHAGTPAEQGHATFWHWPDRPYASVDKYFRMTKAMFSALVAIRSQLPAEALDCTVNLASEAGGLPNCKASVMQLTKSYAKLPDVKETVSYDVTKDVEYVKNALGDFYERASKANYVKITRSQFDKMVDALNLDGRTDAYTALERLVGEMARQQIAKQSDMLDTRFILTDMGRLHSASSIATMDYIDSYGIESNSLSGMDSEGLHTFVHVLTHELLKWTVPAPLSDSHRVEIEDDKSSVRKKEMEIRNRRARSLIAKLYKIDVRFIESNTKDDAGFLKELNLEPSAEPVIPAGKSIHYATFSLAEKNRFDKMIFAYLYPTLTPKERESLTMLVVQVAKLSMDVSEYSKKRAAIEASDRNGAVKLYDKVVLDGQYAYVTTDLLKTITKSFETLQPLLFTFVKDTLDTHIIPSEDNYYYRNARLFGQLRSDGKVKAFLGQEDAWKLETLFANDAKPSPAR